MKARWVAVVTIVPVSVACLIVGWWFWGKNVELITGGTFGAPSTTDIKSDAVGLALGDILLIETPSGQRAAIRFDRMTSDKGADYTSWYAPSGSTAVPTPSGGHVFERYWSTRTDTHSYEVTDIGGKNHVQCGPVAIRWSGGTWLYIPSGYRFAVQTAGSGAVPDWGAASLSWQTSAS